MTLAEAIELSLALQVYRAIPWWRVFARRRAWRIIVRFIKERA